MKKALYRNHAFLWYRVHTRDKGRYRKMINLSKCMLVGYEFKDVIRDSPAGNDVFLWY